MTEADHPFDPQDKKVPVDSRGQRPIDRPIEIDINVRGQPAQRIGREPGFGGGINHGPQGQGGGQGASGRPGQAVPGE